MKIALPYGNSTLTVEVPDENLIKVGYISELEEIKDTEAKIIEHLRNPIGTPCLSSLVRRGDKVCVIADDYTRPCPDDILLPPLLAELRRGGVKKDDINIIIASGLHQPIPKKLEEIVGKEVLEEYEVIYHNADKSEMVSFGETTRGVPVRVNKLVGKADFKVSTGFIEPHMFAGFSGGRKSIMPGVSSRESIYRNHSYEMLENPNARAGKLKGNPVHEDALEHAQRVKHNFIVNVILNRDGKISKIVAGDFIKAHEKGVEMDRKVVEVKFRQKADVTITTNNGYPLDLDLYQTVKGMYTASTITKRGGYIIVASECREGVGPNSFWKTHREAESPEKVLETIRREEPLESQWENQILAKIQKDKKIYLVSELTDHIVEDFMIKPADSVESALEEVFRKIGRKAKIAVLPEGPVSLPIIET